MKKRYFLIILCFIVVFMFCYKPKKENKWVTEEFKNIDYTHYNEDIIINKKNNYEKTFKFEVTNKSKEKMNYNITLFQDNNEIKYLLNKDVKISLTKNGKYIIGSAKGITLSNIDGFKPKESIGKTIIKNQTIHSSSTDKYVLKIWSNVLNKSYSLKTKIKEVKNNLIDIELVDEDNKEIITIDKNGNYTLPERNKDGYNFLGWYTSDNIKINNDTKYKDIKRKRLYALYKKVDLIKEEEISNVVKHSLIIKQENGLNDKISEYYPASIVDLEIPEKKYYNFDSWEIIGDAKIINNKLLMGNGDVIIKAKWNINKYKYTINNYIEELNGTYSLKETIKLSADYNTVVNTLIKSYEGFTNPLNEELKISDNEETNVINNKYSRNKYMLTINPNGGLYDDNLTKELKYEEEILLDNPIKNGYTFDSWDNNLSKMTAKDLTVNAKYSANKYNVSLNSAGGNTLDNIVVTYDNAYGNIQKPTRTGYTFLGWYLDNNKITKDTIVTTSSDHQLKAKWEINHYVLSIDDNDSITNMENEYNVDYGKSIDLKTPVKIGYDFTGWNINGNANIENNKIYVYDNTTIKAMFNIKKYTISFNSNGGNSVSNKTIDYDGTYGTLEEPTRKGYTFLGWYLNNNKVSNITQIINEDHELLAKWEINKHTLTINPGEGLLDMPLVHELNYGDTLELKTPVCVGKNLQEWDIEGDGTVSNDYLTFTMGDSDVTITALYTDAKYNVHFNTGTDISLQDLVITHNDNYNNLPTPVREGYTFGGWYTDEELKTRVTNDTKVINEDHTLYTYWVGIKNTYLTYESDIDLIINVDVESKITLGDKLHYKLEYIDAKGAYQSRETETSYKYFDARAVDSSTVFDVTLYYVDGRGIASPEIHKVIKSTELTNLISNDLNDWNTEITTLENNTFKSITQSNKALEYNVNLEKDHIYYVSEMIKTSDNIEGKLSIGNKYNIDIPKNTSWNTINKYFKASDTENLSLKPFTTNDDNITIYNDKIMLIDVTEFGNQTKEWYEKNISWFNETQTKFYLY